MLEFDPGCEAMIWSTEGKVLMGITGGRGGERCVEFEMTKEGRGGETFEYYIEVACNGLFGMENGGINPPDPNRYFKLETVRMVVPNEVARDLFWDLQVLIQIAELETVRMVVPNEVARDLFWDLQVLIQIAEEVSEESQISGDALYAANAVVNAFRRDGGEEVVQGSLLECRKIVNDFFARHAKTGEGIHKITAIAWLWPFAETRRKSGRSWTRQLQYMKSHPTFTFTASQAQQFEWVEEDYPDLFEEMRRMCLEGRFLPVGGTWVEMDCNLGGGESTFISTRPISFPVETGSESVTRTTGLPTSTSLSGSVSLTSITSVVSTTGGVSTTASRTPSGAEGGSGGGVAAVVLAVAVAGLLG
ncbi:Glycoside hydrolase, 38 vacuolar alpha mannosidase [Dinochytrium kinnereticum]|nr:Glycoside hydrolase, 38 vacuolar alpha mannosidase [Dinochytrium kinnereticum]